MERVTKFDVYFHGYIEAVSMEPKDLFPLLAHPQAYLFITDVQPVGVLINELSEMPKE